MLHWSSTDFCHIGTYPTFIWCNLQFMKGIMWGSCLQHQGTWLYDSRDPFQFHVPKSAYSVRVGERGKNPKTNKFYKGNPYSKEDFFILNMTARFSLGAKWLWSLTAVTEWEPQPRHTQQTASHWPSYKQTEESQAARHDTSPCVLLDKGTSMPYPH